MSGCINTPLKSHHTRKEDPAVSDQAHSAEAIDAIHASTRGKSKTSWLAQPPRIQGRKRQPEPMPCADLSSSQDSCRFQIRSMTAASTETAFADRGHAVDLDLHGPVADTQHAGDSVPNRLDQAHRTDLSDMSPWSIYEPTRWMSVNSLLAPPTRFQRRNGRSGSDANSQR
jgi:hypothetical protein